MPELIAPGPPDAGSTAARTAQKVLQQLKDIAIDGAGGWKGGVEVAEEALRSTGGDTDLAIRQLVRTHQALVATSGAVTGLPGGLLLAVAVPVDVWFFHVTALRMVVGVAHLRGYDVHSEHVRAMLGVTLLGSSGNEVLAKAGVTIGNRAALAQLKRLPGAVLIEINKKVGFRLVTKFGEKGVLNLGKLVPVVGAGVGATTNLVSVTGIAAFARRAFPATGVAESGD